MNTPLLERYLLCADKLLFCLRSAIACWYALNITQKT